MTFIIPDKVAARLSEPERATLGEVMRSIATPHRPPPSVSDGIRAALHMAGAQLHRHNAP